MLIFSISGGGGVLFTNNFNRRPATLSADTKILCCVCAATCCHHVKNEEKGRIWSTRTACCYMVLRGGFVQVVGKILSKITLSDGEQLTQGWGLTKSLKERQ